MNQFRKCESTPSGQCGSTLPTSVRPALRNGFQTGATARRWQHLERLRLFLAIRKRGDGVIIQPVFPIALDTPNTNLARPRADLPPQTASGDIAVQFRRGDG